MEFGLSYKASASSMFYSELRVPRVATGAVIGKKGSTIQGFRNTPGISSVRLSRGRVKIRGKSEKAVQGVLLAIERLVGRAVSRSNGYHPVFLVTCFCKSIAEPLFPVNNICFEKFAGKISWRREFDRSLYICLKTGATCEVVSGSGSSIDSLSAQFSSKMGISEYVFHWDFSAYKTTLFSCLQSLHLDTMYKKIKLVIRFGKQLHDIGPNLSKSFEQGDFISMSRLQELHVQREFNSFFFTACSDTAVRDVRLHLVRLQYEKDSSENKISIHVADLVEGHMRGYIVSVRCDTSKEGPMTPRSSKSPTDVVVIRVRRMWTAHGFVTFCREGKTTSDFRLGIATHEMSHLNDNDIPPGLVEWVEQAWRDRTPDQLLVFPPPKRFMIINIRYKNIETYITEKFQLRISHLAEGDRVNMIGNERWECKLSSRWFKSKYGVPGAHRGNNTWDDVESTVESDVLVLVNEAIKFSEAVCSCG